jgi:hypothetical protein
MKKFVTERMSVEDYGRMMSGEYGYSFFTEIVEAETAEEAKAKVEALHPAFVVNSYVITLEEAEAKAKAEKEAFEALLRKEEEQKQKRIEAEKRRAAAEGLTVEELRRARAKKAKITKLEKEIAELEQTLAYKKRRLEEARA